MRTQGYGDAAEDWAHSRARFAAGVSLFHGPKDYSKKKKTPVWAQWTGIILFVLISLGSANGWY